ncbi:aryl-alcohol dehydrogenase-like predicted oxidoreductase [Actinokineospora baliensis]|uniref:aldo/keto reductase n=1 Tax=Actinokineospora baliensis TaxID=547056 RepID=UPI00195A6613|nr:aldo/keto reductase [Actinokineospora baliensis]MBM7769976.1 aryl-alcohol dehydrogenase-like predicted oxidoreductase [Actinokineospora baliensis]
MEYTTLGRTGLSVSRLVLGTMNFGPHTTEADSHALMDAAHGHGINFFDTANTYGGDGLTEEIIGRWLAKGGRREKTVLATKLYGSTGDWPNEGRLSALNVRHAAEASLRRLGTDHIDLYQMHHVDRQTPWEEIWEGFEVLRQQGKVLYFGSSNFAGWHLAQAQEAAKSRHFLGLVAEQSLYNLANRFIELDVLPAAKHYGIGVIPWSPLSSGILGGVLAKISRGESARHDAWAGPELLRRHRPQVEAYEALCERRGLNPADLALAWLLSREGVTGPIIGPRTAEQLAGSLRAFDVDLDGDLLAELDTIFPPPGPNGDKPAPEAYSW